ncbi:MAG: hypothetical protein H6Q82_1773 [Deltaproteobacteria bacterium]|nr:hypothetical protein [Deltaproteobacteria bacterium]
MILRHWKTLLAFFVVPTLVLASSQACAGWESGAKAGFDTNLSRSIDDGDGSGYLSAYGSYWRGHAAETRLDWTLGFIVQGAVYPSLSEVDYAAAMLSPGVAYIIRPGWTVALTPYLLGKAVRDSEQSALAFGGRVDFSQKFVSGIYLGEYYVYTDSRANEDVYSYRENTLGFYLGMRWTPKVFTEAGYEFSRGDSFLSTKVVAPPAGGGGPGAGRGNGRYSSTFGAEVFKEMVDGNAFSISAGIDWTQSWFSTVNYTYRTWDGDSGSANDSSGYAGIGYRFGIPHR